MAIDEAGRMISCFSGPDSSGLTVGEVAAALDLILASDPFVRVERPSRFLRHLVETTLRGEQTLLKESLLGIQVFGREASWDTRIDPVVRQEAARLRKRLARYYETASPEVRIELTVGTYIPVFRRVAGQLAASDIAHTEVTHPDISVQPTPQAAPKARRGLWLACAAGLLLGAALVWPWRFFEAASTANVPSIVVLPFTNLSADPANAYFADGLTDEITGELVRLKSLKVLARTSALAFKGKSGDVREVGRQLNVSHVLEGSVERSGDQVRISAHLERVSDGSQVWSQTYDRQAKDLLTVQSELAAAIARSLQVGSGAAAASRHVPNEEAHELYLRAVFEMQNTTPQSLAKAEQSLQRAVRIDAEYAPLWFALGLVKYNLSAASGRPRTPAELAGAKALYRKALALDPDLSTAHANLGMIAMVYEWDWAAAERELQLASRNGVNSPAETTYGLLLSYRGRFSEADRHLELARSLDPANPSMLTYIGAVRYWEGRFPEAIALNRQVLERYPDQLNPQFMLNVSHIEAGQAALALANLRELQTRFPPIRLFEVMALGRSGRHDEGLRLIQQLEAEYARDPAVFRQWFALAWASLGDAAQTMKWLERSADLHEFQVLNLAVNPVFAEMRNRPEFRAMVQRIGLL